MADGLQQTSATSSSPLEDGEFVPLKILHNGQSNLPKQNQLPLKLSYASALKKSSAASIAHGQNQCQPSDPVTIVKYRDLPSSFLKPISDFQGMPAVCFNVSEKEELVKNLNHVLIGKFTHGRPLMSIIQSFFKNLKLLGAINVSLADSKHVYIECSDLSDFYWIWLQLFMNIDGFVMRIFKWGADFSPRIESPLAPVWIRIKGIPLYLFDDISIWQIAGAVGKPIKIDTRNLNRSILSFARVCVELDISQKPSDIIWVCIKEEKTETIVERIRLQVFYDEYPHYCSVCSHVGHGEDICKRNKDNELVITQTKPLANITHKKDNKSAPIVAAASSNQTVSSTWIPVKKSNPAAETNSKLMFGSLNLQDEEVSKALGKKQAPGAALPAYNAATHVVEPAIIEEDKSATGKNSSVEERKAEQQWQTTLKKKKNKEAECKAERKLDTKTSNSFSLIGRMIDLDEENVEKKQDKNIQKEAALIAELCIADSNTVDHILTQKKGSKDGEKSTLPAADLCPSKQSWAEEVETEMVDIDPQSKVTLTAPHPDQAIARLEQVIVHMYTKRVDAAIENAINEDFLHNIVTPPAPRHTFKSPQEVIIAAKSPKEVIVEAPTSEKKTSYISKCNKGAKHRLKTWTSRNCASSDWTEAESEDGRDSEGDDVSYCDEFYLDFKPTSFRQMKPMSVKRRLRRY